MKFDVFYLDFPLNEVECDKEFSDEKNTKNTSARGMF